MSTLEQRKLIYTYGPITIFGFVLAIIVGLSYYFSQFIPIETFERVISPCLHGCIWLVAVIGAIVMQFHIEGIYARRMWQRALIAWAVIEAGMLLIEKFVSLPTIVSGGVQTIDRWDFIIRDALAIILLAYPMEVLRPKWLNWTRGFLLMIPPFEFLALDQVLHEDFRALQIMYPLVIAWWLWGEIRTYRAKMEENYSSLENSPLPWLQIFLCILTIIGLSYFYLSFTYHPTRLFTQEWLVLLLLVYNTAQIVFRRKPWKETIENAEEEEEEEEEAVKRNYREKLEAWMAAEKPYLNPDFRLVDLMQVLPMNRSYLSKFINVEYGCSFYQYVTKYRLEEAQRLMRECPELKLQEVAEKSGFSSPTIFSRIFAREIGMTPTEWLESIDNM